MPTPLPRAKVKKNQTWNAESVFASPSQFDAEVKSVLDALPSIQKYKGHLGNSVDTFIEAMSAMDALEQRATKVRVDEWEGDVRVGSGGRGGVLRGTRTPVGG